MKWPAVNHLRSLSLLALALALVSSSLAAQELFFSCTFSSSTIAPITDLDAKKWHDDVEFRKREFVLETTPPKLITGPNPEFFWGEPQIEIDSMNVEITWYVKARPLNRTPKIFLKVNRFSGEAFETYEMLSKPNQGPMYVYWWRSGKCEVATRKF